MLILYHHDKTNPNTKVIFPYKIKQINERLEIKVDALPPQLGQIIYKFTKLAVVVA